MGGGRHDLDAVVRPRVLLQELERRLPEPCRRRAAVEPVRDQQQVRRHVVARTQRRAREPPAGAAGSRPRLAVSSISGKTNALSRVQLSPSGVGTTNDDEAPQPPRGRRRRRSAPRPRPPREQHPEGWRPRKHPDESRSGGTGRRPGSGTRRAPPRPPRRSPPARVRRYERPSRDPAARTTTASSTRQRKANASGLKPSVSAAQHDREPRAPRLQRPAAPRASR